MIPRVNREIVGAEVPSKPGCEQLETKDFQRTKAVQLVLNLHVHQERIPIVSLEREKILADRHMSMW